MSECFFETLSEEELGKLLARSRRGNNDKTRTAMLFYEHCRRGLAVRMPVKMKRELVLHLIGLMRRDKSCSFLESDEHCGIHLARMFVIARSLIKDRRKESIVVPINGYDVSLMRSAYVKMCKAAHRLDKHHANKQITHIENWHRTNIHTFEKTLRELGVDLNHGVVRHRIRRHERQMAA